MQVLIIKDASTKIPKDATEAEIQRALEAGFSVEVVHPDGSSVATDGKNASQIVELAKSLHEVQAEEPAEAAPVADIESTEEAEPAAAGQPSADPAAE